MTDTTNDYNSLNDKTKLINSALRFTNGDVEKAKQMLSGQFNDAVAVKGKFSIGEEIFGVFLIFCNNQFNTIMNANTLLSASKSLNDKIRVNDNWKSFYVNFKNYVNIDKSEKSLLDSYEFTNHLIESLAGYDTYTDINAHNIEVVTEIMTEIIYKYNNLGPITCQVDFEDTNSLQIDIEGIPLELNDESTASSNKNKESSESMTEKTLDSIESQADYVIDGKVIVSPVKGKYINDIKIGEKIKVIPVNSSDEISIRVAKTLKAYSDEGEFLPVKARVKAMVPMDGGGFMIYGVLLKNILIRVLEEENVKIEVHTPKSEVRPASNESSLVVYISLLIGLIIIAAGMIYLLL